MSANASTGSPAARGRSSTQFSIHDDAENANSLKAPRLAAVSRALPDLSITDVGAKNKHSRGSSDGPSPLSTSKFGNIQTPTTSGSVSNKVVFENRLKDDLQENTMDALLATLAEHQQDSPPEPVQVVSIAADKQAHEVKAESSPSSAIMTPASTSSSDENAQAKEDETIKFGKAEMVRLKKELDAARQQLELQKRELDQNRIFNQTFEQALSPSMSPSREDVRASKASGNDRTAKARQQTPFAASQSGLPRPDFDVYPDSFDNRSVPHYNNVVQAQWAAAQSPVNLSPTHPQFEQPMAIWGQGGAATTTRSFNPRAASQGMQLSPMLPQQTMPHQRILSGQASPGTIGDGRFVNDLNQYPPGFGGRRNDSQMPRNDAFGPQQRSNANNGWGVIGNGIGGLEGMNLAMNSNNTYQAMGMYQPAMPYQPRPIGTPLSATATEFRADEPPANPWNASAPSSPGQVYVQPMEPLNYRRLLDRSVSCNWKYIVDKIVCNNDQQASIFLQQKLKVGTVEQKYEIIEAIVAQAYPLMVNRFGNFLVQRCFEHGTPEQVVAIANAIRGNTLSLSMDAFGCHVVQKAFDAVPEEYKAVMVHELLRRIPETVIHRYACHVWQKLFELRWADSPPQIMKFVNEALRGMWHDVALGETGSLVVQNIFENCLEEDKRPCITEVLTNIDIVAHGQFGNWCIQHICEHGAPQDRSRAIDHVLRYATEYSMDQFASKVVEKCLKIGGSDFLERYLERVCEGRQDRPRIPLIDIASDQYGNYLIQYILTHANNTHREIVASNVRKHMVSLRGSKFGSRVGMLCCNPAYATHPGPGVGMANTRYSSAPAPGPRYGGAYR
ncbi:MAG: hypothetical protein Q9185_000704 [Variospora sp. 1 TL-2023]